MWRHLRRRLSAQPLGVAFARTIRRDAASGELRDGCTHVGVLVYVSTKSRAMRDCAPSAPILKHSRTPFMGDADALFKPEHAGPGGAPQRGLPGAEALGVGISVVIFVVIDTVVVQERRVVRVAERRSEREGREERGECGGVSVSRSAKRGFALAVRMLPSAAFSQGASARRAPAAAVRTFPVLYTYEQRERTILRWESYALEPHGGRRRRIHEDTRRRHRLVWAITHSPACMRPSKACTGSLSALRAAAVYISVQQSPSRQQENTTHRTLPIGP
ncbi:hypothetical protein B0H17DRAFT_1134553 [Mycena rosella]|uniref:Uncharacterized protein n=1 Tax=Mycena rosella TaxID=1033263 RepID=A0AAD7GGQ8_MYCRO|nr:hypothetical protein B0H17DRAFT_1134553 [Mycena rosella]